MVSPAVGALEPLVLNFEEQRQLNVLATKSQVTQCDVIRKTMTRTSSGGTVATERVNGSFLVKVVPVQNVGRNAEEVVGAGRVESETFYYVLFPISADVTGKDRLRFQSFTLEAINTDRAKSSRTRRIVLAKEIS